MVNNMNTLEANNLIDTTESEQPENKTEAKTETNVQSLPAIAPLHNLAPLSSSKDSPELSRLLQSYLVLVIITNFSLLFLRGHGSDIGFWHDWVRQLSTTGYDGFNGNYPPLYVHWLYLVGKFYTLTGIPLEGNDLLKFLAQIPVTIFHCLLSILIFSQLKRFNASRPFLHAMMLLTVLNPAILVDGPIWGQVDLPPAVMVFCALLLAVDQRWSYLSIPVFTLALLTKFQMIAIAPVFGFLFFRNPGKHLIGMVLAVAIAALVFLPSILAGHFSQAFRQAYIDTLGQYPMTTYNAANIWILLTGNTAPDNVLLFGVTPDSSLAKVFTAKYFGMLLFSLTALYVFLQGIHFLLKNNAQQNDRQLLVHSLFAAMICAVGFFTLLPAMHERYIFPAVVMALAYAAMAQQKLIYPIIISLLSGLNMLIILEISGSDIWHGLSWLIVAVLVLGLGELIMGDRLFSGLKFIIRSTAKIPLLSVWVFIIGTCGMTAYFNERYQIYQTELNANQRFLTDLPLIYAKQDHGKMALHLSYEGNRLSIANRRYAQGIGTHASSDIQYQLPEGASEFSFSAGLDDEVGTADVQFSVWGDDKLLWQSKPYLGNERDLSTHTVDVRGVQKLNLKIAPLTEDKWDHADWANTIITFATEPTTQDEILPAATSNPAD